MADAPAVHEMDGWALFDAVSARRRNGAAPDRQPEQEATGQTG